MRTLTETDIDFPAPLEAWVEAAGHDPAVRSVILFGSRALGHARPTSDWDFALIVDAGKLPSDDLLNDAMRWSPKHGAHIIERDDLLRKGDVYASFENEVTLGVIVDGENYEVGGNTADIGEPTADAVLAFGSLTEKFWYNAIAGVELLGQCKTNDFQRISAMMGNSVADAAECAAKLTCMAFGLKFAFKHKLDEVADSLAPGNEALANRIKAMNGDTHKLHVASYRGIAFDNLEDAKDHWVKCHEQMALAFDMVCDLSQTQAPLTQESAVEALDAIFHNDAMCKRLNHADETHQGQISELLAKCRDAYNGWRERLERDGHVREHGSPGIER